MPSECAKSITELKVIAPVNRYDRPHSPFGILSSVVKKRWPPEEALAGNLACSQGFRGPVPAVEPSVRGEESL